MKTIDQIKAELEALKVLTPEQKGAGTEEDQSNMIEGVIGELEWVVYDDPQEISLSQLIAGANALVKE